MLDRMPESYKEMIDIMIRVPEEREKFGLLLDHARITKYGK